MTKEILLEINGKEVTVNEGTTILQAAKKLDIEIPTLCSHKALLPYGACRLCLVEITPEKGTASIQASCTYPALASLKVQTASERVIKTRKIVMELLLAKCPDAPKIKSLAKEMGIEQTRIRPKNDDCILCGLCVRMCEERMGRSAISFVGRGQHKKLTSPFGQPNEVCQTCGACDFICPTGKIIMQDASTSKPRPIPSEFDSGLVARPAVYIPYPQAVPNVAKIDKETCVKLQTGECGICKEICEAEAIDYEQQDEKIEINTGALIITPGVETFDANLKKEYGFDRYPNVITSLQFERILSSSGPTAGEILRPSDNKSPKEVAFIQCVGSRDSSLDNEFCSAVCCMYSLKESLMAKEHDPEIKPTIFYIDMRCFGKDYDRYLNDASRAGINLVRCMVSKVYETPQGNDLYIKYLDEAGVYQEKKFDLVVLAVGITNTNNLQPLVNKLKIQTNDHGFNQISRNDPGQTTNQGIYVAGSFNEPKDIPDSVIDGSSAAALTSALLKDVRGSLVTKKEYPKERDVKNEDLRIGVFICRCGRNIASVVKVPAVVEYASKLEGVAFAREFLYSCSQDSLVEIRKDIDKHNLNRVIVAACTPRTHEQLFRDTVREGGLNKYLFEMTSLREQVSWVHKDDPQKATEKSKELVKMMVAKVRLIKPLYTQFADVIPGAMIVGGGAAGMQAAISLANQGFTVNLIEREKELGGHLNKIFYNLEDKDLSQLLKSLIEKVSSNEKIRVHTSSELKELTGFAGNFTSTIEEAGEKKEIKHGALIVATGGISYEPAPGEYGFGNSENILTQEKLEEELTENPQRFSNPQEFVMIQCVGSRSEEHPFCSRVCCAHAIKNGLKLKELNPEHKITVLYRDIRTYGFLEKYYLQAREAGIVFSSFSEDNPPQVSLEQKQIAVKYQETLLRETIELKPQQLILSTGMRPSENKGFAKIIKTPLNRDDFYLEAHPKIRPLDFSTDGIFLCGLAHSPRFVYEALAQGQGAAMRAATILSKDKIEAKANIACVNERLCKGCEQCISVCPYSAREMDEEKGVAKVIDVLCQGCGACAVTCPSGATTLEGFERKQILSMVEEAANKK